MILQLPYPPTANTYYRNFRGRMVISARGREFARAVAAIVGKVKPLRGRVGVGIALNPPDQRKRDIDNTIKPTLDALTKAGVWLDDSQIDILFIARREKINGGRAIVTITEE